MVRVLIGVGSLALLACAAQAQTADAPSFDVASIKPAEPQPAGMMRVMMRGGPGSPDPGQITYSNVTLRNVLMNAYDVKSYQIQGPAWLESERYDITAKVPKGATKEQFRLMLQNLLAERFKVAIHKETKEMPIYSLVVAKGGVKMKESVEDPATPDPSKTGGPAATGGAPPPPPPEGAIGHGGPARVTFGKDGMPQLPPGMGKGNTMMMMMGGPNGGYRMTASAQTMSGLVNMLAGQLGKPVQDNTGLTAKYDFTLNFAPEEGQMMKGPMGAMPMPAPGHAAGGEGAMGGPMSAPSPDAQPGPSLFTAVQEQLGLKLEPKKGPVELIVIDRAEKTPTEN